MYEYHNSGSHNPLFTSGDYREIGHLSTKTIYHSSLDTGNILLCYVRNVSPQPFPLTWSRSRVTNSLHYMENLSPTTASHMSIVTGHKTPFYIQLLSLVAAYYKLELGSQILINSLPLWKNFLTSMEPWHSSHESQLGFLWNQSVTTRTN